MLSLTRRSAIAAACGATLALSLSGPALSQDTDVTGPVILTVTGNLAAPTRQAYSEADDKFFGYQDVDFDMAAQFDVGKLMGLELHTVKADFPKGGQVYSFEGPLLADVLKAAGADGKTITVQALDGYAVEADVADLVDAGAVVALSRDGQPFAIGDYGPTQIVFPRAERADLADMSDDNWVWSIYHINVK
ncbi:hypothetical protein [Pseudaestuariivita atlantica]|uniref:hypothetical protein n=1 Tax=Pseudaestuariivita atlantica TaxID=1317121 RepID=UPI00067D0CC2|nr:hypothetical protein [Pseudaestuariivita atlantica]